MSASESTVAVSERRRSNRKPMAVQAYIASPTATRKADRIEVTSVNISKHGVAFELKQALSDQTYWRLDVNMDVQKISCEICIVSCRANGDGTYHIGAEFC